MTNAAMLEQSLTGALTREFVEAISVAQDEPPWLRDRRLEALAHYEALAWPSGQEEEWRRTPQRAAPLDHLRMPAAGRHTEAAAREALQAVGAAARRAMLAHCDTVATTRTLSDELAAQGVLLLPLSQAAREHEALVRPHLHSVVPLDYDRFTALGGALWSQGIFCYVPRGVTLDVPLVSVLTKSATEIGLFGHTLIVAESLSSLTFIEVALSPDQNGASLSHQSVEVLVKEGADARVLRLQNWGHDIAHFAAQRIRLERDAHTLTVSAAFGGHLHKERLEVDLRGDGSAADLLGFFVATGEQHIEYDTRQDHVGVGTRSDLLIKGALDDESQAVQYGVIRIGPDGQKANGLQTFRNLLLSEGARADPIPVLEIEADDVKCAHAAAVGPVDREQLFYLESRGIPPDSAERMIVHGFLDVVADQIPDAGTRDLVESIVTRKLRGGAAT